jgi:hypothetical protein
MNKQRWIDLAEVIDALRVFPKIILILVLGFCSWYIFYITGYYFGLEKHTAEITAFISVTVPSITGIATLMINKYFDTGRKWVDKNTDHRKEDRRQS